VLECEPTAVESAVECECDSDLLSGLEMARFIRKRNMEVKVLLVHACDPTPADEGETDALSALPQVIQDVLGMFKDVFPAQLPPGLPPDRQLPPVVPLQPQASG
jgi:hypothetical protein